MHRGPVIWPEQNNRNRNWHLAGLVACRDSIYIGFKKGAARYRHISIPAIKMG